MGALGTGVPTVRGRVTGDRPGGGQNGGVAMTRRQRRAEARREVTVPPHAPGSDALAWPPGVSSPDERVRDLVAAGVRAVFGPAADDADLEDAVAALVDLDGVDGPGVHRPERLVSTMLVRLVARLWEQGWQPLDLVHAVRRHGKARPVRLVTAVIAFEAEAADAHTSAPAEWNAQLGLLGVTRSGSGDPGRVVVRWRVDEGVGVADAVHDALVLVARLGHLPALAVLAPPPSRWGQAPTFADRPRAPRSAADAKVLATIRALLAKAESTTFPAEAEAFSGKAQDLMTRHAIDAAVIEAEQHRDDAGLGFGLSGDVVARRVHIDNPYATEKAHLFGAVAAANDVRVVWDDTVGIATAFGFPLDLDLAEMLFTSLLIQATRAVSEAARDAGQALPPYYRRAFLLSYATRIGERLHDAHDNAGHEAEATYGAALVPLLAERVEAVAERVEQVFPRTVPLRARSVDAAGWDAGQAAADAATLGEDRGRR